MGRSLLDDLFEALLPFAKQQLEKHGAFHPFGAQVDAAGTVASVAGMPDDTDQPSPQSVIEILVSGMKMAAADGAAQACGICFHATFSRSNASTTEDAICLKLEASEGKSLAIYVPCTVWKTFLFRRRTFTYGDPVASPKPPEIFI